MKSLYISWDDFCLREQALDQVSQMYHYKREFPFGGELVAGGGNVTLDMATGKLSIEVQPVGPEKGDE